MGALDGLKVLDLTSMVSGPVAAMMMADQGARVIKVEPLVGEQMRHIGGKHNDVSPAFYSCNRGKESISLDLKSEEEKRSCSSSRLMLMSLSKTFALARLSEWALARMCFVRTIKS